MFSVGLAFLLFTGTSYGLTPKERELVQGLTKINKDLREQVAVDEKAITQKDANYVFLQQKNESLSLKLEAAKKLTATQETELSLQQQKAKDQAAVLFQAEKDRDQFKADAAKYKRQAHVKSVVIDVTLGIIAIAVTVLVGMCSGQILGWIARVYPPSAAFGMLIEIGLLVGTPLIVFGFLKGVLAVVESRL